MGNPGSIDVGLTRIRIDMAREVAHRIYGVTMIFITVGRRRTGDPIPQTPSSVPSGTCNQTSQRMALSVMSRASGLAGNRSNLST